MSNDDFDRREYIMETFFHDDKQELLPIPVSSCISPSNSQQFFVHMILKFGQYITEIYALQSGTPRECFVKTRLIKKETDDQSLREYSSQLLCRYIEEEVVWLANSTRKTDYFIVTAQHFLMKLSSIMNLLLMLMPSLWLVFTTVRNKGS